MPEIAPISFDLVIDETISPNPPGPETPELGVEVKTVSSWHNPDHADNIEYGGGSQDWHDVDYAKISGNYYAYVWLNDNNVSEYLKVNDFDFNIPTDATILGITVDIERKVDDTSGMAPVKDYRVRLVKNGVVQDPNRATNTAYTETDTYESHGGSADLWDNSWTPADINDHDFGVVLAVKKDGHTGGWVQTLVDHVRISVTYNVPPVANDDSGTLDEDSYIVMDVLANDSDSDSDILDVTDVTMPAHGVAVVNGDNTISYAPNYDFYGSDSFVYTINDGHGGTDTATVNLTINPVNDAPVAYDVTDSTNEDMAKMITLNATDVDSSPLDYYIVSGPSHGSLSAPLKVVYHGKDWVYTPNPDWNGIDTFTYKANDSLADSNIATVTITVNPVNDNPVANDDGPITVAEDSSSGLGVLDNDNDIDGDTLSITNVTDPANGTATNMGTYVVYTPDLNYYGSDSFDYTISDGNGGTDTATVTMNVTPVNDAPAAIDHTVNVNEDMAVTINFNPLVSDPEGNPWHLVIVTDPAHGTLTPVSGQPHKRVYIPNADYNGPDSFTYRAKENGVGGLFGNIATIYINVMPKNDVPVAYDDAYTAGKNTTLNIPAVGVLANDVDIDGDTLNATLAIVNPGPHHGSLSLNSDGSFSYTPDPDYLGTDKFFYRAYDGHAYSERTRVDITVNDSPVSVNDSYSMDRDTTLTVAAPGVITNDTDPEGDPLTVVVVDNPTHGSVTLNVDGSFDYTPISSYFGSDSFTYKANDGHSDSNTATVNITVNDVTPPTPPGPSGVSGGGAPLPGGSFPFPAVYLPSPIPTVLGVATVGENLSGSGCVPVSDAEMVGKTDKSLVNRLKGRILLQVQSCGEGWYLDPVSLKRYFLNNGKTAMEVWTKFALKISNKDLAKITIGDIKNLKGKKASVAAKYVGRILMSEDGQLWYVNPGDGKRYLISDADAAYQIIKYLGLGITNKNLAKIPVGE